MNIIPVPLFISILCLFIASFMAFYNGIWLLRKQIRWELNYLGISLFLSGGMILSLMGLRTIFGVLYELYDLDKGLYMVIQMLSAVSFIFIIPYFLYKVTKKKTVAEIGMFIATIFAVAFAFIHYKEGIEGPFVSDWGSEYAPPKLASLFIGILLLTAIFLTVLDMSSRIKKRIFKKLPFNKGEFFISFGYFLILAVGPIESFAGIKDWRLLLLRMIIVAGMFIIYLAITSYPIRKENSEPNQIKLK